MDGARVVATLEEAISRVEAAAEVADEAPEALVSLLQKLGSVAVPILLKLGPDQNDDDDDDDGGHGDSKEEEEEDRDDSSRSCSSSDSESDDDEGVTIELVGSLDAEAIASIKALNDDEPTVDVVTYDDELVEFLSGGFRAFRHVDDDDDDDSSDEEEAVVGRRPKKKVAVASDARRLQQQQQQQQARLVILREASAQRWDEDRFLALFGGERVVSVQGKTRSVGATARAFRALRDKRDLVVADSLVGSKAGRVVERAFARLQRKCAFEAPDRRHGRLDLRWAGAKYDECLLPEAPAYTLLVLSGTLKVEEEDVLRSGDCLYVPANCPVKLRGVGDGDDDGEKSPVLWTRRFWRAGGSPAPSSSSSLKC